MSLTLYYHPLSSFCWKVLVGLYENDTPFERVVVNLGDEGERAAFHALWPIGKFPVIEDKARGEVVPESSPILDYLDRYHPGPTRFTPADPDLAWRTRLWDRILDMHVHLAMQTVVGNRIRPPEAKDPHGVAMARAGMSRAYGVIEDGLAEQTWLSGDDFGLADCAALPALFYADKVNPWGAACPRITAYLERLKARPSVVRVLAEAEPFFQYFPSED
jgi:glutathione S-transferase